jgi:hypothetical protein
VGDYRVNLLLFPDRILTIEYSIETSKTKLFSQRVIKGGVIIPLTGVLGVDLIPVWLVGIELSRVSEDIRPKSERY